MCCLFEYVSIKHTVPALQQLVLRLICTCSHAMQAAVEEEDEMDALLSA